MSVAGSNHTCAVNFEDQVFCFGDNSKGQLGQAEYEENEMCERNTGKEPISFLKFPLRVKDSIEGNEDQYMSGVRQVAVGGDFNCAKITQSNNNTGSKVKCWGNPDIIRGGKKSEKECYPNVQVPGSVTPCNGTGTVADIESPPKLIDLSDVEFITAGRSHACSIRSCSPADQNEVLCWGDSSKAQLGRGGTSGVSQYMALPVISEFGTDKHIPLANIDDGSLNAQKNMTCVSKSEEILCWGQYQSPLEDDINQVILPERLSRQCEARGQTVSNFLK